MKKMGPQKLDFNREAVANSRGSMKGTMKSRVGKGKKGKMGNRKLEKMKAEAWIAENLSRVLMGRIRSWNVWQES